MELPGLEGSDASSSQRGGFETDQVLVSQEKPIKHTGRYIYTSNWKWCPFLAHNDG